MTLTQIRAYLPVSGGQAFGRLRYSFSDGARRNGDWCKGIALWAKGAKINY